MEDRDLVLPLIQVPIASLGQYSYCPRRCALMYVENVMEHNEHTIAGSVLHEVIDEPGTQSRRAVKRAHALPIFSDSLGLIGKADLVEFVGGKPQPIEFKKGKRSTWENNQIQVCAQALCLEEMFNTTVPEGAIFNLTTKKRVPIPLSDHLREITKEAIWRVRELFESQFTPPAELKPHCEGCSLIQICLPKLTDPSQDTLLDPLERAE